MKQQSRNIKVWVLVIIVLSLTRVIAAKNNITSGIIAHGTWFNLILPQEIESNNGIGGFNARVVDPIYNQDFSALLIPANAQISGSYDNNRRCKLKINAIEFNDTVIEVNYPEKLNKCIVTMSYKDKQQLEFKTLADIPDLEVVNLNEDYVVEENKSNFMQVTSSSGYEITQIEKFTNGLMQISVKFSDRTLKSKLVPVYYDKYGVSHYLNYALINRKNNVYDYLVVGKHNKFGIGINN